MQKFSKFYDASVHSGFQLLYFKVMEEHFSKTKTKILLYIMPPTPLSKGWADIVFGMDPEGVSIAFCLHSNL